MLAQSCGLSSVAVLLAYLLDRSERAVREQLRDFYRDAARKSGVKRGHKRRSLEVCSCFAPLVRWVLALHPDDCRHLALAMDASTLGQRFTLLTICVRIRGCSIPVAWHIVEATRAGAWRPHWETLFEHMHGSVPLDWTVTVAADRGLYAKWLFTTIQTAGWHPFLRINRQGQYCLEGASSYQPLSQVVTAVGQRWAGRVTCFKTKERQLVCSLLSRWDVGYREPWLVVTDVAPQRADVAWYGLRAWIACGYKDAKRGGWHWEQTKMSQKVPSAIQRRDARSLAAASFAQLLKRFLHYTRALLWLSVFWVIPRRVLVSLIWPRGTTRQNSSHGLRQLERCKLIEANDEQGTAFRLGQHGAALLQAHGIEARYRQKPKSRVEPSLLLASDFAINLSLPLMDHPQVRGLFWRQCSRAS